jgi:hypothetical protein
MGQRRYRKKRRKKETRMPEPAITNVTPTGGQQPSPPSPLTTSPVNDAWFKVIARYDFYYGSVNTKAALLIAFDTFVVGGVALKWADLQPAFNTRKELFIVECCLMLLLVAASLVSLAFTFWAINPFLSSPRMPNEYHSLIFFGDVKEFSLEKYYEEVQKLSDADLRRDLAYQAHTLAGGLSKKFANLWWATLFALCVLFLAMCMAGVLLYALADTALTRIAQ